MGAVRQDVACSGAARSSVNILTAWSGDQGETRRHRVESRSHARAPWSCSPCWRPSRDRVASLEDQLGLDDESNLEFAEYGARAAQLANAMA